MSVDDDDDGDDCLLLGWQLTCQGLICVGLKDMWLFYYAACNL